MLAEYNRFGSDWRWLKLCQPYSIFCVCVCAFRSHIPPFSCWCEWSGISIWYQCFGSHQIPVVEKWLKINMECRTHMTSIGVRWATMWINSTEIWNTGAESGDSKRSFWKIEMAKNAQNFDKPNAHRNPKSRKYWDHALAHSEAQSSGILCAGIIQIERCEATKATCLVILYVVVSCLHSFRGVNVDILFGYLYFRFRIELILMHMARATDAVRSKDKQRIFLNKYNLLLRFVYLSN